LHPGSGSERKNWPERCWAELLQQLVTKTSLKLLLVGGEAEAGRVERLAASLPPDRLETASNLPLPELALRLAGCGGFVGHDSGISHLAAAVGLPGVVLWGETAEAVWGPRSARIKVLRGGPQLEGIGVTQALEALLQAIRAVPS
jgi:ADP-heptose:LPS heptosyltransferase